MTITTDDTVTKMSHYISFVILLSVSSSCFASTNKIASCYQLGTQEDASGQSVWNKHTLQCKCLPHVVGLNCDQCENGYYNILSTRGCASCQCNPEGTKANSTCDSEGKCQCKDGYKGYRCDEHLETCSCSTLLKNSSQYLLTELHKINTTINTLLNSSLNNTDSEEFKQQLSMLMDSIQKLHYKMDDPLFNNQDQITSNINDTREYTRALILKLTQQNATDVANVALKYQLVFNISEDCKQKLNEAEILSHNLQHDDNMTVLSKEAKKLVDELLNMLQLLSEIENQYQNAKQGVEEIAMNIADLNNKYQESTKNLTAVRNLSSTTSSKSAKAKEVAITNQKLLENIHMPMHNKSGFCTQEIPDFKSDLEDTLSSRYESCYREQSILERLSNELKNAEDEAVRLEKQKEKDSALLQAVYEQALNLIDKLDNKYALNVLDISDINEENENKLLILQEELEHLIKKLEIFSDQLFELELISNNNLDFIEDLKKQLDTSKENLEKIKELDIIIEAVPITEDELNNIEGEINKGNEYFQLLQNIKELEQEVNTLESISSQLNNLPETLCSADVHPEGVTLP